MTMLQTKPCKRCGESFFQGPPQQWDKFREEGYCYSCGAFRAGAEAVAARVKAVGEAVKWEDSEAPAGTPMFCLTWETFSRDIDTALDEVLACPETGRRAEQGGK